MQFYKFITENVDFLFSAFGYWSSSKENIRNYIKWLFLYVHEKNWFNSQFNFQNNYVSGGDVAYFPQYFLIITIKLECYTIMFLYWTYLFLTFSISKFFRLSEKEIPFFFCSYWSTLTHDPELLKLTWDFQMGKWKKELVINFI